MEDLHWTELIKVFGPLAIFVPMFIYLLKFILENYKADIESRVKLAGSLDNLSETINERLK